MKTNTHAKPAPDNETGLTHGASRSDSVVDDAVLEFVHGKAVRSRAITLQMLETPDHSLKTRSCRSRATIGWTPTLRRASVIRFRLTGMQAGFEPVFDNIKSYLRTDYTEDVTKFDVSTLPGSPDRVAKTRCARLNADLADFVKV